MSTTCLDPLSAEDYASTIQDLSGRRTKAWESGSKQFASLDAVTFQLVENNSGRKVLKQVNKKTGGTVDLRSPPLEVTGFLNDDGNKNIISFQCEESRATPELAEFWDVANRLYGPDGELAKAYTAHHKDMIPGSLPKGLAKHVSNDGVASDLNCDAGVRGRFFFSPLKQNRGEGNQMCLAFKVYTTAPKGDMSTADRNALADAMPDDHPLRVSLENAGFALASNAFTVADGKPIEGWTHGGQLQWLRILGAMSKPTKTGVVFKGVMSLQMAVQASWVNDNTLFTTAVYLNGPGAKLYATPAPRSNGPVADVSEEDADFFDRRAKRRKLAETNDDDGMESPTEFNGDE